MAVTIKFIGKYKSLTSFTWDDVPSFVVLTGPNGSGKSQLLDLIYNTVINKTGTTERVAIANMRISPKEVTFLRGEWQLQNTSSLNLASLQQVMANKFQNFRNQVHQFIGNNNNNQNNVKANTLYREIFNKYGGNIQQMTQDEFSKLYPEDFIEQESQISQKISEVFYNYRLSEIECLAKSMTQEQIRTEIGEKPWVVLRDIIKASKLPFDINDPSECGFRDNFQLRLKHQVINEEINFNDLSSGEKVLISLVFYLYNSQEKKSFPKLLMLDEPDAHLHPSMSQQFLNVIKNVLVDKYDVRVIMTTHSPSTVILAPQDSIYEMSRDEPRIRKCVSKNHAVSSLTAGLIYVGEGTKYFLVEDKDDVDFYSYVYKQCVSESIIDANIPFVFMPASTKDKSGGKDAVQNWVSKLRESGLDEIIHGLIDADNGNVESDGIYKINRYSIENYLVDPIIVYAALLDKEKQPQISGLDFAIGEEYKLKNSSQEILQIIADQIFSMVESEVTNAFPDYNSIQDGTRTPVAFTNGIVLFYPKWLLERRGKTILNDVYNKVFTSPVVNFGALFKSMRKLNLFPMDLVSKISQMRG